MKKTVKTGIIRVGLLDDEVSQLKEYKDFFKRKKDVDCLYTTSSTEAVGWAINGQIDVLVSDLNLAQEEDGTFVLKSAWDVNKELILILFSAYFIKPEKSLICEEIGAIPIKKQEGKETLYANIIESSLPPTKRIGGGIETKELKQMLLVFAGKLLQDLESLKAEAPDFKIHYGKVTLSPSEMISEINGFTEIGRNFIKGYFHGNNILKGFKDD